MAVNCTWQAKPGAIMPFMSAINPKLYEKTCCSLLIINFAEFTVCYNKYVYVCDVVVYSIQVYSKLYSLHQIVVSYKLQVTSYKFTLC